MNKQTYLTSFVGLILLFAFCVALPSILIFVYNEGFAKPINNARNAALMQEYGHPAPNPKEYCENELGGSLERKGNVLNSCRTHSNELTSDNELILFYLSIEDGYAYHLTERGTMKRAGAYYE